MAENIPSNVSGPMEVLPAPDASLDPLTEQDTAMTDAPVAAAAPPPPPSVSTPTTTAPPARTTTPQRNGLAPPVTATPAAAIPSKAPPHGARCRQYLNSKVTYVLLEGMKKVASEQPEDPLRMLGEFLIAKSKDLEGT